MIFSIFSVFSGVSRPCVRPFGRLYAKSKSNVVFGVSDIWRVGKKFFRGRDWTVSEIPCLKMKNLIFSDNSQF